MTYFSKNRKKFQTKPKFSIYTSFDRELLKEYKTNNFVTLYIFQKNLQGAKNIYIF